VVLFLLKSTKHNEQKIDAMHHNEVDKDDPDQDIQNNHQIDIHDATRS